MTDPKPRPIFTLRLTPEKHCTDPDRMVRRLLKIALRKFGLRCVSIEEAKQ